MKEAVHPTHPVLIIDDDEDLQRSYAYALRDGGVTHLAQCTDSRKVEALVGSATYDTVLLDLNMPHVSGRDLLPGIVRRCPDLPVIVVTGVDEVDTAVQCMRAGAFDYLVKPIDEETLLAAVHRAIEVRDVLRENALLKQHLLSPELTRRETFAEIVTDNKALHALFQYIEAVAVTSQPILITGETGTGKELIARAIHQASGREGAFVPVNIAGLDDNVFSDTLFGHLKGAYTGASEARKGLIERATGGTLFLDEIGDMNTLSQVKLLRLSQEREYHQLGSDIPKRTTARLVVATNRDLRELLQDGKFREDLFFRLRSHRVHVPPLRERTDDIPLLLDHFLRKAAAEMDKKKPTPPPELLTLLANYPFPGNVRELESMCYDAVSRHRAGVLSHDAFKEAMTVDYPLAASSKTPAEATGDAAESHLFTASQPLPSIRDAEALLIQEALRRTDGNQTMAAQLLGITRQTLSRHLRLKK